MIAVSTVPLPVMMMTCGGSASARRCLSVSSPSISGMMMSIERDVERLVAHRLQRRAAVAHADDVMSAAAEERAQNLREILLVLGDEDANAAAARCDRFRHAALAGSRMRNTLPSPTTLSTSMRPPCSVTIA